MNRDEGQSLVEIAIALPLLLLILIGIFDVGRVMHYTIALSAGAERGAAYAARLSTLDGPATLQRICDGSGLTTLGSPCPGMTLANATRSERGQTVEVTYDVELFYGRILGAFGAMNPMHIRATATYPVLAP